MIANIDKMHKSSTKRKTSLCSEVQNIILKQFILG